MRVNVLDSIILDSELFRILTDTLSPVISTFHLTRWSDEIQLLLKFFLWKYSVYENGSSIGQNLLGLTYPTTTIMTDMTKRKRQLILHFILDSILPYFHAKLERLLMIKRSYWKWFESTLQLSQFLNFCLFLRNGCYPSLAHRFTSLHMVLRSPTEIPSSSSADSSTQTRQLVWHYFADFLTIVLPIIKIHRLRSYMTRLMEKNNASTSTAAQVPSVAGIILKTPKCCFCKDDTTIATKISQNQDHNDSQCTFCYYCLSTNPSLESNETICNFHT